MRAWRAGLGGGLLLLALGAALLSRLWLAWDVAAIDVGARLLPPSLHHPLGTDQLGRDLLAMLVAGATPALGTAALATAIGLGGGVPLGLLAALCGGWIDEAVARTGDILFAFPALVLALLLAASLGPGAGEVALALGLVNVPVLLRVARGAAAGALARDYILAARMAGRSWPAIAWSHVLPNIAPVLAVQAAVTFSLSLLGEAGLAFLGLGAQPPTPDWGRMVADAQTLIGVAPRLVLWPGGCIVLTVLATNLLANALRAGLPR